MLPNVSVPFVTAPPSVATDSSNVVLFVTEKEKVIGDKLAYRGSLSASLSQELIVAYRWLAYRVPYRVVAARRCGQQLGGGRRRELRPDCRTERRLAQRVRVWIGRRGRHIVHGGRRRRPR